MAAEELRGTYACPICGYDKPHAHGEEQVAAYHEDQIKSDGWISTKHQNPKCSGWFLCDEITIDPEQYGAYKYNERTDERRRYISWLLWVRSVGVGSPGGTQEVLYWDSAIQRWRLRTFQGNAVPSGAESRYPVIAEPKYWRELPASRKAALLDEEGRS